MSDKCCVVIWGQFNEAADPINLPHFRDRLTLAGWDTILIDHMDSKSAVAFLRRPFRFKSVVGASLGAGAAPLMAGYACVPIDFVGGFQPSWWDPVMHSVNIPHDPEPITKAVTVPTLVKVALCFRNPIFAATGGLGHATYIKSDASKMKLTVIDRPDVHPGDFGEAQDIMFNTVTELANERGTTQET